jgi:hypothetical protein
LSEYPPRIEHADEFARRHRVLLLRRPDGVGIAVSLGALPFEECVVNRASVFSFGDGLGIRTCSAEDLVVLKLFASWCTGNGAASTGATSRSNCVRSQKSRRNPRFSPPWRASAW